jgi:hypothetical protein
VKQQVSLQLSLSRQALGRLHVAHLPRCQALLADQLSRIYWCGVNTFVMKACFAFQRLSLQLCAILCKHKIMLRQQAASERDAPFYERIIGRFIASGKN